MTNVYPLLKLANFYPRHDSSIGCDFLSLLNFQITNASYFKIAGIGIKAEIIINCFCAARVALTHHQTEKRY
jgi:hypothetical protein